MMIIKTKYSIDDVVKFSDFHGGVMYGVIQGVSVGRDGLVEYDIDDGNNIPMVKEDDIICSMFENTYD